MKMIKDSKNLHNYPSIIGNMQVRLWTEIVKIHVVYIDDKRRQFYKIINSL